MTLISRNRNLIISLVFQDLTQLHFDYEKGSPEEILMNLAKGETTYAVVYDTLCRFVFFLSQDIILQR